VIGAAAPGSRVQNAAKWATKMNILNKNNSELLRQTTFTLLSQTEN
jgi:hypothetical protein